MRHAKDTDKSNSDWKAIRDSLAAMYHPDMKITDVIHVVCKAHAEAVKEPRFQMCTSQRYLDDILLSLIQGSCAIEFGMPRLDTSYTVEQFYNAILNHLMSGLRMTRIDWLRAEGDWE